VAAAAPIWMGANSSGSPRPEARQKTTSPSTGVKTGSMARPIPAVADRATIEHCRLSSAASVQTQTGVEFPSGTRYSGASFISAITMELRTGSPTARGPASTDPSASITSPIAFTTAIAATVWPVPVIIAA
jgi:hypothetical protein